MSESGEVERLNADLLLAREAAARAERLAGEATGRLRELEDQLGAATAAQLEWDELIGHIERERVQSEELARELEALKSSTTWQIGAAAMAPYQWVRARISPNRAASSA